MIQIQMTRYWHVRPLFQQFKRVEYNGRQNVCYIYERQYLPRIYRYTSLYIGNIYVDIKISLGFLLYIVDRNG